MNKIDWMRHAQKYMEASPGRRMMYGAGATAAVTLPFATGSYLMKGESQGSVLSDIALPVALSVVADPIIEAGFEGYGRATLKYAIGEGNLTGFLQDAVEGRIKNPERLVEIGKRNLKQAGFGRVFEEGSKESWRILKENVKDLGRTIGEDLDNDRLGRKAKGYASKVGEAMDSLAEKLTPNIKGLVGEGAEKAATANIGKINKWVGRGLVGAAAMIGAAAILDVGQDLENDLEADKMRAQQEKQVQRRLSNRKGKYAGYGLPGDPTVGMIQNIWNQRTNHTSYGNARF